MSPFDYDNNPVYYWEQDHMTEEDLDDLLNINYDSDEEEPEFDAVYEAVSDSTNTFLEDYQGETLEQARSFDLAGKEGLEKNVFSYIQSVVGDDEITTTNSKVFGALMITIGPVLNGVRLSPHDLGMNHRVGNYAEEYILTPPHREASHSAVIGRHLRDGIPYVLDTPKLKLLSAVRKQSTLDLDFESKYSKVDESAAYVNPGWFTYGFHQMSKILATAVFDFHSARSFPFLGKTEGGCGGKPPYNQYFSVITALHHFNRGKAKESVLGIMEESTKIHIGSLKPSKGVFMKAVHAAQIYGVDGLESIHNAMKALPNSTPEEKAEFLDQLIDREPLPTVIRDHEAVLHPQNYLLGATVSQLRNDGLIMTELDVRMIMAERGKISALKQDLPMRIVLEKKKKDVIKAKRTAWKIIKDLSGPSEGLFKIRMNEQDWLKIITEYYRMRDDIAIVTGLSYADMIKVYPAYKVRELLIDESLSIKDDIINSMPISQNLRKAFRARFDGKNLDFKDQWVRSNDLTTLLTGQIPEGIGPDDPRIARKIGMIQSSRTKEQNPVAYIIISNDAEIGIATRALLQRGFPDEKVSIVSMNIEYYLSNFVLKPRYTTSRDQRKTIPDIFTGKPKRFPMSLDMEIRRKVGQKYDFMVLWDFPNVHKRLTYTVRNGGIFFTFDGGFLRKETLKNLRSQSGWTHLMMNEIEEFDDFKIKKRPSSFEKGKYTIYLSKW